MTPVPDVRHVRSVLFVCLGNICRSPLAQGVFSHLAAQRGVADRLAIESCGTSGWHIGESPDPRTIEVARRHGILLRSRARRLNPEMDFVRFDLLLAMDAQNLASMRDAGAPPGKAFLFRTFDPAIRSDTKNVSMSGGNLDVPDPYHGGPDGVDLGFEMVHRTSLCLLDHIFPRSVEA